MSSRSGTAARTTLFALALSAALPLAARAQTTTIKLGTLAPVGSTWHSLLQEMGRKWAEASNGTVKLKIYAGGQFGNEGDMVRKMNIGQIQSASITAIGLHEITPEPQAMDLPLMIESYDEYDYVQPRIQKDLEAALAAKGYVVIQWGEVGFVRFFSTKAYATPEEMATGKIFTWEGDPEAAEAWKQMGLRPVVISSTDIIPSLQTGMINIVPDPALYAFTAHLFDKAKYMLDLNWGFLTGATVVKKDAWERIPEETRKKLLDIAADYGKRTATEVRRMNDESIAKMKEQGLTVVAPKDVGAWRAAARKADSLVRGKVVPAAIFDKVKALRDEYRASKGK